MTSVARAQLTIAVIGLVAGILGLVHGSGGFADHHGHDIGYASLELHLMSYNRIGGLVTAALSALAIVGAVNRRSPLVIAAAAGFGLFALQTLVGFRAIDGNNITGANGATLSFCFMMTIGLATLVWADHATTRPGAGEF
jgi:hypothetical protein